MSRKRDTKEGVGVRTHHLHSVAVITTLSLVAGHFACPIARTRWRRYSNPWSSSVLATAMPCASTLLKNTPSAQPRARTLQRGLGSDTRACMPPVALQWHAEKSGRESCARYPGGVQYRD